MLNGISVRYSSMRKRQTFFIHLFISPLKVNNTRAKKSLSEASSKRKRLKAMKKPVTPNLDGNRSGALGSKEKAVVIMEKEPFPEMSE